MAVSPSVKSNGPLLKSVSDILRGDGICIGEKQQENGCRSYKISWFGYESLKREIPSFDTDLHCLPHPPNKLLLPGQTQRLEMPSRRPSGIERFRTIANTVKSQNIWWKSFESKPKHLKTFAGPIQADGTREILTFDVSYFKTDKFTHDSLGMKAKAILVKPTLLRSEHEIKYLYRYTLRLKCLRKYPIFVRMELSKCLLYDKYEKGRVVLRQGDVGYNFYFIISGSVLVEIENINEKTGKLVKVIAGELKAGSSFGDVALVRQSQRMATIVCHEDSEFLIVAKPDFDEVLKKNHERDLQHCLDLLHKHQLFKTWDRTYLDTTIGSSKVAEYMHGELILKDLSTPSEEIHCIVRGTCLVIQKVKLWEMVPIKAYTKLTTSIHAETIARATSTCNEFCLSGSTYRFFGSSLYQKVVKYWAIRTLKEGDFFGLGEGREDMTVVASDKTILLLVHKSIIREYGQDLDLGQLRGQLIKFYPSKEDCLRNFLSWKRRMQYQKKVVLEAIGRKLECKNEDHYILAS